MARAGARDSAPRLRRGHALVLLFALSRVFAWANARRLAAVPTIAAGALVAGIIGACLGAGYSQVVERVIPPPARLEARNSDLRPRAPRLWRMVLYGTMLGEVGLGLWALVFVFPFALDDARVHELEAEKLRLEADRLRTAAELARLRAHLEPHNLRTTLNAIAGLVTDDPREARRLLAALGDLLRDSLREEGEMQTLDEQVAWLRRYAQILEARHPEKVAFRWEIAAGAREVLLPRLLLQPLVENAVKHGVLRRSTGGGEVVVRAEVMNGETEPRASCAPSKTTAPVSPRARRAPARSASTRCAPPARAQVPRTPDGSASRSSPSRDPPRSVEFPPQPPLGEGLKVARMMATATASMSHLLRHPRRRRRVARSQLPRRALSRRRRSPTSWAAVATVDEAREALPRAARRFVVDAWSSST